MKCLSLPEAVTAVGGGVLFHKLLFLLCLVAVPLSLECVCFVNGTEGGSPKRTSQSLRIVRTREKNVCSLTVLPIVGLFERCGPAYFFLMRMIGIHVPKKLAKIPFTEIWLFIGSSSITRTHCTGKIH